MRIEVIDKSERKTLKKGQKVWFFENEEESDSDLLEGKFEKIIPSDLNILVYDMFEIKVNGGQRYYRYVVFVDSDDTIIKTRINAKLKRIESKNMEINRLEREIAFLNNEINELLKSLMK